MVGEDYNKNDQAPQAPQQATKWDELSSEGVFNEDQAQANRQEAKEQIESIERQELEKTTIDKINQSPKAKKILKKLVISALVGASIAGSALFMNQAMDPKPQEIAPKETISQGEAITNVQKFMDVEHRNLKSEDLSWDVFIFGRPYGEDNSDDPWIVSGDGSKEALWLDDKYNNTPIYNPDDYVNSPPQKAEVADVNRIEVYWRTGQQKTISRENGDSGIYVTPYEEHYCVIDDNADGKWDTATKVANKIKQEIDLHEDNINPDTLTMQKVEDLFKNTPPEQFPDVSPKNTEAEIENAGENVTQEELP